MHRDRQTDKETSKSLVKYQTRRGTQIVGNTLCPDEKYTSTQQKVTELVQNCKYLPEILNSTTTTIFTREPKALWKYSWNCQI